MESNKIEQLLIQLLENQKSMQSDITEIKDKINLVYNQTATTCEDITTVDSKIENLSKDIKFIKHKLHETEEDVFDIKDHLKIIK